MPPDNLVCPYCRVGRLDLKRANVVYFHNWTFISAPNTPAWQCDICHYRELDANALRRLGLLVQRDVPPFNQHRFRRAQHGLTRYTT